MEINMVILNGSIKTKLDKIEVLGGGNDFAL